MVATPTPPPADPDVDPRAAALRRQADEVQRRADERRRAEAAAERARPAARTLALPDPDEWERVKLLRFEEAGRLLGVSEKTVRRLAAEGETVVLCYDPDRASRAGLGASLYLRESVKLAGARMEYVLKSYADDLSGDLLYAIDSWRSAEEVEKLRERTQRGRLARIESGKPLAGGRPIYGYRWIDAQKSRLEPDPVTAPVAIRIVAAIAGGATLGALARRLTVEGVPTPAHTAARPIHAWNISTLHTMVKNPAYKGQAVAHRWRTVVENGKRRHMLRDPSDVIALPDGSCPALVDETTWQAAQAVLIENRRKTQPHREHPTTHLLRSGYAVCGYCQSRLYPVHARKRTERSKPAPPSYRCSSYQRGTGCTHCVTMSAPLLDPLVWAKIAGLLADPAVLAEELERRRQHDPTKTDLEAVDRTLAGLGTQRRNYVDNLGLVSGQAAVLIGAKLAELERDEARLHAERQAILRRQRAWQAAQVRLEDLSAGAVAPERTWTASRSTSGATCSTR